MKGMVPEGVTGTRRRLSNSVDDQGVTIKERKKKQKGTRGNEREEAVTRRTTIGNGKMEKRKRGEKVGGS
jgi:hypothetical protein